MKTRKKRKKRVMPLAELVHPTYREKMPSGTFKPLVAPINELTISEIEKAVRKEMGRFHLDKRTWPNRGQLGRMIFNAIDFKWGAADLPPDEYADIHFRVLGKIYERPQRRLLVGLEKGSALIFENDSKKSGKLDLPPSNLEKRPPAAIPQAPPAVQADLFGKENW